MKTYKVTDECDEKLANLGLSSTDNIRHIHQTRKDVADITTVDTFSRNINDFFVKHRRRFKHGRNIVLLLLYLGYYGYAMYCNFGDEGSIRLTIFTALGLLYLGLTQLKERGNLKKSCKTFLVQIHSIYAEGRRPTIIRWTLYFVWTTLFLAYIVVNVVLKNASNLKPLGGMVAYVLVLVLFSNNRRLINWHCVFYGTILQCLFGLFVIKTNAGTTVLMWFSDRLSDFLAYADAGSRFVFGEKFLDHPYAMQTIPAIIMFVAVITVLIYLGAIQTFVRLAGTPMAFILDVSAPESMNAVANIFLGGAEAGATIVEYLPNMHTSKLFCVCVGGFASCAGSNLIQYRSFGVPLQYLLAASAMSAPAALVCAKIVYPDVKEDYSVPEICTVPKCKSMKNLTSEHPLENMEEPKSNIEKTETVFDEKLKMSSEMPFVKNEREQQILPKPKNMGEALVLGTKNGVKLSASIVGLLIVSLALIELLNKTVEWFGDRVDIDITLNKIMSYLFYPLAYIMGVDTEDCLKAGEFLGLRTLTSPGVPYIYLGQLIRNRELVATYTAFVAELNETFSYDRSNDIFLPYWNATLPGGVISERSELIITYALCGFASIPTIGVTFGLITSFIPDRLPDITSVSVRLLLAGTIASYLTACVAGLLT